MHLSKDTLQKPIDRRVTAFNINYLAGVADFDHRFKDARSSPISIPYVQCQKSIDITASNGCSLSRNFRSQHSLHQQQLLQPQQMTRQAMNDVTYCFQRVSNV